MTSLLGSAMARLFERRALTASNFFGFATGDTVDTKAGVSVTQDTATRMSAVFGAQALITDDIASLPFKAYRNRVGQRSEITPPPTWMRQPVPFDPNLTMVEHISEVVLSILSDGNAFIAVIPNFANPTELRVLDPQKVDVKDGSDGPIYLLRDAKGITLGTQFTPFEIIHISYMRKAGKNRGLSPIEALSEAIGSGIAAEEFSSYFFGNGANMQGVIEVPREAGELTTDQIESMRRAMKMQHTGLKNSHAIGILQGGAHLNEMTVKPSDALLIEAQQWSVEQIARAFKIPPHLLGSQIRSGQSYASVEQKSQDYVTHAIAPLTTRIQTAYSRLLPLGSFVEFDLRGLLRADAAARATYYNQMMQTGGITPNIIAELENYPTFEGGDSHYLPTNNLSPIDAGVGPDPNAPTPPPEASPGAASANPPMVVLNVNEGAFRSESHLVPPPVTADLSPLTESFQAMREEEQASRREFMESQRETSDRMTGALTEAVEGFGEQVEALKAGMRKGPVTKRVLRDENERIIGLVEVNGAAE